MTFLDTDYPNVAALKDALRMHGFYPVHKKDFEGDCCYDTWASRCRYMIKYNSKWRFEGVKSQKWFEAGDVNSGEIPGRPGQIVRMMSLHLKRAKRSAKHGNYLLKAAKKKARLMKFAISGNYLTAVAGEFEKDITIELRRYDCDGWFSLTWAKTGVVTKDIEVDMHVVVGTKENDYSRHVTYATLGPYSLWDPMKEFERGWLALRLQNVARAKNDYENRPEWPNWGGLPGDPQPE